MCDELAQIWIKWLRQENVEREQWRVEFVSMNEKCIVIERERVRE